jgi:hypothetical protein
VREWIYRQWADIKGNFKVWLLLLFGSAAMTCMAALTHGLQLWQQVCLIALFGVLFCWALAATILPQVPKPSNSNVADPVRQPALGERIFTICREMSDYMEAQGARPDEDKLVAKNEDFPEFIRQYREEIQPWDDKLAAGYYLKFRDRLVDLSHELTLHGSQDGDLDTALADLDKKPTKNYMSAMKRAIERFRYLASALKG